MVPASDWLQARRCSGGLKRFNFSDCRRRCGDERQPREGRTLGSAIQMQSYHSAANEYMAITSITLGLKGPIRSLRL